METIKNILRERGLTQADMAASLQIDFATVNRWVNGKMEPRAENRRAISDFLGLTVVSIDGRLFALPRDTSGGSLGTASSSCSGAVNDVPDRDSEGNRNKVPHSEAST